MFAVAGLKHADPIIYVPGAGEKRLDRTEAAAVRRPVAKAPAPRKASPPRRAAPVVPRGAPVREDSPPRRAVYNNNRPMVVPIAVNPAEARNQIWGVIQRIAWCNVSDGDVDVAGWYRGLSERDREIFKAAFSHYQTTALNHAEVQTIAVDQRADLATHMVMMGRDFYDQCMEDAGWIRFLIEQNDYQKRYQTIMDTFEM